MKACITYAIVTPESAEQGDVEDHGFWMPGGYLESMAHNHEATLHYAKQGRFDLRLRSVLRHIVDLGGYSIELFDSVAEGGLGLSVESEPNQDSRTCAETRYMAHITGLRKSSRGRVVSYLKSKGARCA